MLDILCLHFALMVLIPDSCIVRATCCVYFAYCFAYLVQWMPWAMVDCVIVCHALSSELFWLCFLFGAIVCVLIPVCFCRPVMSVSFQRSVLKVKVFLQCLLCVSQAVFFEIGACAVCL